MHKHFPLVALSAAALVLLAPPAKAAHTPFPASVTAAGSFQSELGCPGDWQPECATTHLAYDAEDTVWQGTWALPAGSWEFKAALDAGWDENYGANAERNGANVPLSLAADATVKFYYDHGTHWITSNRSALIATAPGSFQSELGCASDWDPACLRSWLQDPDGDGIYRFSTSALPAGSYEVKATIDEGWEENYGVGGVPNGPNIPFSVPGDGMLVTFLFDPATSILSVELASVPAPGTLALLGIAFAALGAGVGPLYKRRRARSQVDELAEWRSKCLARAS